MLHQTCCIRLATSFNTFLYRPTMLNGVASVFLGLDCAFITVTICCEVIVAHTNATLSALFPSARVVDTCRGLTL